MPGHRFSICLGFLSLALGCVSAKIAVVDERTALENQILGSYEDLDRNLQLLASVRAVDASGEKRETPSYTQIREEAIRARQTQQFNRDDIDEMKRAGCLGEANTGSLALRECEIGSKPEVADRLRRLVESENQARSLILRFVLTTSPDLSEKDSPQLQASFIRMQRENAKKGEWVQEPDGRWQQIE